MILGLIQVRMGSTRLPEKSLMDMHGKPMLWHLVNRVKKAKNIDNVVIATTVEPQDKVIVDFAEKERIDCYAGSEMDILDRLYQTTKKFGGEVAVRITGDCPLTDPGVIDKLLNFHLGNKDKYDVVTNISPPSYPDGLDTEVLPMETLERAWNEVEDPMWREWATAYFYENQDKYKVGNVSHDEDLSHHRWTVDYEEDFDLVKKIFAELGPKGEDFSMKHVLELLKENDHIYNINRKYRRDEAYEEALKEKDIDSNWR